MATQESIVINNGDLELMDCNLECPVCLQTCVQPVKLPCKHIFCYLCVKGAANLSKRCALCRSELPLDFLDSPELVKLDNESPVAMTDGHDWFYEGHNGWWQYDHRTSSELETAFKREESTCEVLIAGYLYIIDFEMMLQYRRHDPSKRRRIKRDLVTIAKKGIAGIRLATEPESDEQSSIANKEEETESDTTCNRLSSIIGSINELTTVLQNLNLASTEDNDTDL